MTGSERVWRLAAILAALGATLPLAAARAEASGAPPPGAGAPATPLAPPRVEIVEASATDGATLGPREGVYLHVRYESAQPLRFQAAASRGGVVQQQGASMNTAPRRPAGRGEAAAWIAFEGPMQIDTLLVRVFDARWKPLFAVSVPASLRWSPGPVPAGGTIARPEWATRLLAEQDRATREQIQAAAGEPGWGFSLVFALMYVSVPGYLVAQIAALLRLRGRLRWAGRLPLVLMVPVGAVTVFGLLAGSNLWPLYLIFASPPCFLYLLGVFALRRLVPRFADEGVTS